MIVRLTCIVEIETDQTDRDAAITDAQNQLDTFRESVVPSFEYGITIYQADGIEPTIVA